MHSRWARNQQRLAGSTHMWHILSFTGHISPQDLKGIPPLPPPPGDMTDAQRRNHKLAVEARAKLRPAKRYSHLRRNINRGGCPEIMSLAQKQTELLAQ